MLKTAMLILMVNHPVLAGMQLDVASVEMFSTLSQNCKQTLSRA